MRKSTSLFYAFRREDGEKFLFDSLFDKYPQKNKDALLLRALRLPGDGRFESSLNLSEKEAQLRALDTMKDMWLPEGDVVLSNEEEFSFDEMATLVDIERLRNIAEYCRETEESTSDVSDMAKIIRLICLEMVDIFGILGVDTPVIGDVILATSCFALGALKEQVKVSVEHLPELVARTREVIVSRTDNRNVMHPEVGAYFLYFLIIWNMFTGGTDISFVAESFRNATECPPPTNFIEFGYANAVTKACFDIRILSESVFHGMSDEDAEQMRHDVAGAGLVFLLAGKIPSKVDFWFDDELFDEIVSGAFSPAFPAYSASESILVHEAREEFVGIIWRAERFTLRLMEEELICRQAAESSSLICNALIGRMSVATGRSAGSAWARHKMLPGDVSVASPVSTPGFLERLDEWAEQNSCGAFFRECFVLDALEAFSVTKSGCDLEYFSVQNGVAENKVLDIRSGEHFVEWLVTRTEEILEKIASPDADEMLLGNLTIPCIPAFASAFSGNVPMLFRMVDAVSKPGKMTFQNAFASLVAMRSDVFLDALDEFFRIHGTDGFKKVSETLAILAEGIANIEEADDMPFETPVKFLDAGERFAKASSFFNSTVEKICERHSEWIGLEKTMRKALEGVLQPGGEVSL